MAKKIGQRTITVIREPKTDRLDDPPAGPPAEHDVEGCAVVPRAALEEGKGWVNIEGWTVFAPYGADVLSTDRVRYDGRVWDVDGVPADYENKRAKGKATLINLKRQGS
jgi:hypothetical protein